jgi:HD-GYP domain-containing protein (c-di-GMP phosphodiesterase class II)
MRLTSITRAVGLRLARDLPAARGGQMPLLRAGASISERYERVLTDQGIHAVWVEDPLSDGIEPAELISESVRGEAAGRLDRALAHARVSSEAGESLTPETLQELSAIVDIVAENTLDPDAGLAIADLAPADQYLIRHPINVTALGLTLGRIQFQRDGWVDYRGERRRDRLEERLWLLGMGLLLHDIGTMTVPLDVLNKPGKLDDREWALMRGHPEAGVAMLNPRSTSPLVLAVVRDHHERIDGGGYPRGISGEEIHPFARIAAVADVYDAVTSNRPYRRPVPRHEAVSLIVGATDTAFDPDVVATFRGVVSPYPVGTEVRLADGRTGVVAQVDPETPDVPLVRVADGDGSIELHVDTGAEGVLLDA